MKPAYNKTARYGIFCSTQAGSLFLRALEFWILGILDLRLYKGFPLITGLIYVQVFLNTGLTVVSSNRSAGLQMCAVGHQTLCILPGMFYIASMYVGFTASFSY